MPKIRWNENINAFLSVTGLGSSDIHQTVNHNQYWENYINPENPHGSILPLFQLPDFLSKPSDTVTLQCDQYSPDYEKYYLAHLAKSDLGLANILQQYEFNEKFVKDESHYAGPIYVRQFTVDSKQEGFSDFIQAIADHFDRTRFGYCSHQRAINLVNSYFYENEEKEKFVNLLNDIRNTTIELHREAAKNQSHLFPKDKLNAYHSNLKELEKAIKSFASDASSRRIKAGLWGALRVFLLVIKTICPIAWMEKNYNNVSGNRNFHRHYSHAPERLSQSFRLFQERIDDCRRQGVKKGFGF